MMIHPVTNRPADKRSFIPSLIEKEKVKHSTCLSLPLSPVSLSPVSLSPVCLTCPQVSKLVHAIKMGWIKPRRVEDDSRGRYYDLWSTEDSSILAKHKMHLPAPKIPLPGHQESYNPPPEYLFTDEEVPPTAHLFNSPGYNTERTMTHPLCLHLSLHLSLSTYLSLHLSVCSGLCGSSRIRQTGSCHLFRCGSRASVRFLRFLVSSTRGLSAASTFICAPARGR